jgi:Domain of unknown function (DUF1902)
MAKTYTVHAHWDEAATVWWTDGEDIPGLTCDGDTFDALADVVFALGPQLLRDNHVEVRGQEVMIIMIAERHATACIAA